MAGLDTTTFAFALKQHYIPLTIKNLAYDNNPYFSKIKKVENFGGANMPLPVAFGNPQGRSANFANAVANKTNTQGKVFTLTRVSDYSLANISNEVLEASAGNADAFMKAATTEIDGAINAATRSLAVALHRNGTGSVGTISAASTVGSPTITLSDINLITNFEVGMVLQLAATDGAAPRAGTVSITGINRATGTLTASGNWTAGIAAAAVGDFILQQGDSNAKISGLDAWLPMPGVLTSTLFFGVDRTADATRLGGISKSYVGSPIEEGMIDLAALIAREGGRPDLCILNYLNYANLEKALGTKVIYVDIKVDDVEISFTGIKVMGPNGPITVIPDQNQQNDRFFMLQQNTFALYSLGMAPKIIDGDGLSMLRNSGADSYEVRSGYYAQVGCTAPGYNGVGQLA